MILQNVTKFINNLIYRNMSAFLLCGDTFSNYFSIHIFSIVPYIIDVMKEASLLSWFQEQFSTFNGDFQPEFSEVRTTRGYGYTFNLIDADELLNMDQ